MLWDRSWSETAYSLTVRECECAYVCERELQLDEQSSGRRTSKQARERASERARYKKKD